MNQSKSYLGNWLLILGVITLAFAPVVVLRDAEFTGADSQAESVIMETQPEYQPWFNPIFDPPSGEVESLLFTSQAALGAGVMGYVLGLYRERSRQQKVKK